MEDSTTLDLLENCHYRNVAVVGIQVVLVLVVVVVVAAAAADLADDSERILCLSTLISFFLDLVHSISLVHVQLSDKSRRFVFVFVFTSKRSRLLRKVQSFGIPNSLNVIVVVATTVVDFFFLLPPLV
jgi:hypothetical protein